jgi:hypothetical protein
VKKRILFDRSPRQALELSPVRLGERGKTTMKRNEDETEEMREQGLSEEDV